MTRSTPEVTADGGHRLYFSPDLDKLSTERSLWHGQPPERPPCPRRQRLHEALHRAIETDLTDKQRTAVRLFFFEGLSQGEIARRLSVSQQVVSKRLFGDVRQGRSVGGAIARLRKVLGRTFAQGL